MEKRVLPLLSGLLVLALLLGTFATAKAAPGDDPVVTPVSGDADFITEVIPIAFLPGTIELAGGMLAPFGFPEGEAQFGGNGILVTGFSSGKALACFNLSAAEINQGWGGKVALWTGSEWLRLATTITLPEETNLALACATITGSGTYAFIKYVSDPDKLPRGPVVKVYCSDYWVGLSGGNPWHNPAGVFADYPNSIITYQILDYTEPFFGDLSGSVMSDATGYFYFDDSEWSSTTLIPSPAFTIHFETPGCYMDWIFEEGFFTQF